MGVDAVTPIANISNDLIADYLAGQRPQAVAALLLMLDVERASAILTRLPEALHPIVLGRMRRSRVLAPDVRSRLVGTVEEQLRLRGVRTPAQQVEALLSALPEDQRTVALSDPPPDAPQSPLPQSPLSQSPLEAAAPKAVPGLIALVNDSRVSVGRLPMLEVALDRFVRLFQSRLGGFLGERTELTLEEIRSVRFGDYLNGLHNGPLDESCSRPLSLGIFRCLDWNHYGLLAAEATSVGIIADLTLGDPAPSGVIPAGSSGDLEQALFGQFCESALDELQAALEAIAPGRFELDRVVAEPRFAMIDRPANAVVAVRFRLLTGGAPACFDLVIPNAALEPVRARLSHFFDGEKFGNDPFWADGMRRHLLKANVKLSVVTANTLMTLAEVAAWRLGTEVPLRGPMHADIGGMTFAHGHPGQRGGFRTFEVTHLALGAEEKPVTQTFDQSAEPVSPATVEPAAKLDLAALGDVTLRVSAVVGSVDLPIADILRIGRGAIVELDRRISEQIDVLVNDRLVAKGRIVIVEDRIAVAIEELL
jgi:flagellar motor switch protein FliM